MTRLTHLDDNGRASMVDVGGKPVTQRSATAGARVVMQPSTLALITEGKAPKGDVLAAARIAGIMAAKRTHELIPLCHPLGLDQVHVEFEPDRARASIVLSATVKVEGKTGVEMEAMVAVSIAALTIYDMCKGVDRAMEITDIRLMEKTGGKSGTYRHDHR
jgi:cyclic pyranopterin phosphate synthase